MVLALLAAVCAAKFAHVVAYRYDYEDDERFRARPALGTARIDVNSSMPLLKPIGMPVFERSADLPPEPKETAGISSVDIARTNWLV